MKKYKYKPGDRVNIHGDEPLILPGTVVEVDATDNYAPYLVYQDKDGETKWYCERELSLIKEAEVKGITNLQDVVVSRLETAIKDRDAVMANVYETILLEAGYTVDYNVCVKVSTPGE